jgi:hypothetical protein
MTSNTSCTSESISAQAGDDGSQWSAFLPTLLYLTFQIHLPYVQGASRRSGSRVSLLVLQRKCESSPRAEHRLFGSRSLRRKMI